MTRPLTRTRGGRDRYTAWPGAVVGSGGGGAPLGVRLPRRPPIGWPSPSRPLHQLDLTGVVGVVAGDAHEQLAVRPLDGLGRSLAQELERNSGDGLHEEAVLLPEQLQLFDL